MPGYALSTETCEWIDKHIITDNCPFCKAKPEMTTFTADYKNKIKYYTCEKCLKQWQSPECEWKDAI